MPAGGGNPVPERQPVGRAVGREKDDHRLADQIVGGKVAHALGGEGEAAVEAVVSIVAHHEVMAVRDDMDRRVVVDAVHLVEHIIRSEEHTTELQSLMRNSYDVFRLTKKIILISKTKHNLITQCNTS